MIYENKSVFASFCISFTALSFFLSGETDGFNRFKAYYPIDTII